MNISRTSCLDVALCVCVEEETEEVDREVGTDDVKEVADDVVKEDAVEANGPCGRLLKC